MILVHNNLYIHMLYLSRLSKVDGLECLSFKLKKLIRLYVVPKHYRFNFDIHITTSPWEESIIVDTNTGLNAKFMKEWEQDLFKILD